MRQATIATMPAMKSQKPSGIYTWSLLSVSALARSLQAGLILEPTLRVLGAKLGEVVPREQARVVAVVEDKSHGIAADRFDAIDRNILLARDQHFRRRAV